MRDTSRCICNLLLFFSLLEAVLACGESNFDEDNSFEATYQCNIYCLNALKPLIDEQAKKNEKIEICDVTIQDKNKQIEKLTNELAALQANITIYKELEHFHNEKGKLKDELVAIFGEESCSKRKESLIESLKVQIDDNTEAVRALTAKVVSLNSSILLNKYNAKQQTKTLIAKQPRSCVPFGNSTSIHLIDVIGFGSFMVLCDGHTAGSGWTVVQRRFNGTVNFYRSWSEYREGFGDLEGEFFIGLEKLYYMTKSQPYELYIELVDFKGEVRHALYDNFLIGNEEEQYMLKSLGTYLGNAGNALAFNLHDKFTTYDRDHDGWGAGNCADWYESGWWYNLHGNSNLNGKYFESEVLNHKSIWWHTWKGYFSLKSVRMLIRPKYTLI